MSDLMDNNTENIIKHMEYRGYKLDEKEGDIFTLRSESKVIPNIVCWNRLHGLRMISAWRVGENKNDILAYYQYLNKLNFFTEIGRYVDRKDKIHYLAYYFYPYEKTGFSNFIDLYRSECDMIFDNSIGVLQDYIS